VDIDQDMQEHQLWRYYLLNTLKEVGYTTLAEGFAIYALQHGGGEDEGRVRNISVEGSSW